MVLISFIFVSPVFASVVINEFNPNASPEWVELYNASDSAEYLKSYYLDDDISFTEDSGSGTKKLLTELITMSATYPYIDISSFLNNGGDYVVIFDSLGSLIDQYQYTHDPGDGITIGRSPDNTGSFSTLAFSTKGSQNSQPPTVTPTRTPTPSQVPSPTKTPTSTTVAGTSTPTHTKTTTPTKASTPTSTPADIEVTGIVLGDTIPPAQDPTGESKQSASPLRPLAVASALVGLGLALMAGVLVWQKRNAILKQ